VREPNDSCTSAIRAEHAAENIGEETSKQLSVATELEEKGRQQATDAMLGGILEIEIIVCNQDSLWHTTISDDLAPPMSLMSSIIAELTNNMDSLSQ